MYAIACTTGMSFLTLFKAAHAWNGMKMQEITKVL